MWRNRNLWIIMSGEFIAGLGLWLGTIGNLDFLQSHVQSDFLKSAILFTGLFVGVLLGPYAGKLIDRSSKKKVLNVAGFVRMIGVSFMFLALWTDSILWMIGYSVVIVGAAAFYFPALNSLLPKLVEDKHLMQANGMQLNVQAISRIIGTALGGIMLVYTSLSVMYGASIIAYFLLFLFTLQLKVDEHPTVRQLSGQIGDQAGEDRAEATTGSKSSGFKEVIPVMRRAPEVVMALFLTLVPTFFIGSFNLMVLKISELQHDNAIKALLYTAEGASFMLGAFLIKRMSRGKNLIFLMLLSAAAAALAQISLYYADHKLISIITFALFGWAAGAFYPMTATLFQKSIPKSFHGRFFSFRGMMDRVLFQVVLLGTGFLLDMIGFKGMVLCFGIPSVGIVLYFAAQQLRRPLSFVEIDERQPTT